MTRKITRIQLRRAATERWAETNPILATGEMGVDIITNESKIGNGIDRWLDLPSSALSAANAAQTAADRVQTGLDVLAARADREASAASATAAELAALAAGAPIVIALTDPVPANGTVELLKLDAGLQVHEVVAGAWVLRGWLVGPTFDTRAQLLASTAATLGPVGQIVEGGGFRYQVAASAATDHHLTTAGGVKLYRVYAPRLRAVSSQSLPVQSITLPATFNNKLGAHLYSDGTKVRYLVNPYDLIDFMRYEAVTNYYVNFATGNNSNDGLSTGTAWKTIDHARTNMVSPAVLNVEDEIAGFLSKGASGGQWQFSGKLKIKSASSSGRTIFAAMREDRLVGAFSWTASGSNGAYVSTTAAALFYRAQFDAKFRDEKGIPLPITAAATIADCQNTRGTYFWDAVNSHLYVHMHDGRIPDPADGWLYAQSPFRHEWQQALDTPAGVLLFENCDFLSNNGTAPNANWRFRPVTAGASEPPNESYVGLRNCLAYGGSANQYEVYDAGVTVLDNCHAKWSPRDCFNYHSFRTADTRGEYMTVYEHDCTGFYAGFAGFADQPALGTSENITTAHDSMHILRTNSVGGSCRGAVLADVNGCHSLNYNVGMGDPGAAAIPKALFWHEKFLGVGTTEKMLLWGCYGTDGGDPDVFLTTDIQQDGGAENKGDITIQHWRGQMDGRVQGVVYDINGTAID